MPPRAWEKEGTKSPSQRTHEPHKPDESPEPHASHVPHMPHASHEPPAPCAPDAPHVPTQLRQRGTKSSPKPKAAGGKQKNSPSRAKERGENKRSPQKAGREGRRATNQICARSTFHEHVKNPKTKKTCHILYVFVQTQKYDFDLANGFADPGRRQMVA